MPYIFLPDPARPNFPVRKERFRIATVSHRFSAACLSIIAITLLPAGISGQVKTYDGGVQTRPLVTEVVNEGKLVALSGNTRSEANAANDRGAVPDSFPTEHVFLQLQRPAELERELTNLIDEMHKPGSPQFHKWLTAEELGRRFGPSGQDVRKVTDWLTSHGFQVNSVDPTGLFVDFSGNAGQVRAAFHTEIHNLDVNGEPHIANMRDPQIPAALAGVVKGVVSLHNFFPHPNYRKRAEFAVPNGSAQAVGPGDLATIYNLNALFAAGITGAGHTVAVIEDTDLYNNGSDVATFRSSFGLSSYSGTFATVHPGTTPCADPGVNGDEGEAAIDAEWAGAAAPGATIWLASCKNGTFSNGLWNALVNLVITAPPPEIISISYGGCEAQNGSASSSYSSAYQSAAAQGVSVFVSSGDSGAAGCDPAGNGAAAHGVGVNALASTLYNVAVGGTDFSDTYSGTRSTYWNPVNTTTEESAISYIPEIPWNDSCASSLIFLFHGYIQGYGSTGFCNNGGPVNIIGGGGGPSIVWSQPAWQSVLGLPTVSGGPRYLPDVSLFAANGVWGHYYVYCMSDPTQSGAPCLYTNSADTQANGAGGTSFTAPIMAGIMALVNQSAGSVQGLPNQRLYALAAAEYGTSGSTACNSSLGNQVGSSCFFYDVTLGDNDVPCTGAINCFGYSKSGSTTIYGALSTSSSSFNSAYGAAAGWDFATGIGTVNAYNLVYGWVPASTTTAVTSGLNPAALGASVVFTATITSQNQQAIGGTVAWSANTGCGTTPVTTGSAGVATCTTSVLPAGSDSVTATYSGDITHNGSSGSIAQQLNQLQTAPTVTFTGAPSSAPYYSIFTVTSTTNAGNTPVVAASGACSIAGSTVTMTSGTGSCLLTATWAATGNYSSATLSQTTTASLAAPAVTFTGAPGSAAYNSTFPVVAPVANGVTPTIAASGACTIAGSTVTMTSGTGTCTLTATWAATSNYSLATLTQTTAASLAAPAVTFTGAPGSAAYNSTFPVVAPVTNGVTPTIAATAGVCTISSGMVTMTSGTGTCTLTATWAATSNYSLATLTQTTTAGKIAPTVTFTGAPSSAVYNSTFPVVAPAANGVTPTIAASGACSIAGSTVTMTSGTGTCTLTATWAATSNYSLATLTQTTAASLAAPAVTFTGAPGSAAYNSTFPVVAPAANGVTPSIAASGACTILSGTVTMTSGTGTCTLTATWAATSNYSLATLSQTTTASKIAPTVTFTGALSSAAYNSTFPVVAPAANGVTPSIAATAGVCTISSGTVTMTSGTGTCTLTATWAATSNYSLATLSQTTTASKIAPTVTFTGALSSAAYNSTFPVVAPAANGVTPSIAASGVCAISSGTVTMTSGIGTCTLTATWAATSNYSLATLTQTTTASLAVPAVTFTGAPGSAAYNSTFPVVAPVANGVTPTIAATAGVCTISSGMVTMTSGTGTCTLTATWAATSNYSLATLTQTTTASKIAPTVTFTGAPSGAAYNSTFVVVAPAANGVTPTIAASGACTILSGTVTMTSGTGTCTLTATWAATSNYSLATLTQTTTAGLAAPAVTFTGAPGSAAYNSTFAVVAPAANGVTAIIAATAGVCTISSGTVTMTSGTGTCTLTATWAATGNYLAATLTQTTTASLAAPAVTFTGAPGSAAYNSTFVVVAPVANGVTPTIAASGACTISSGTVTMTSGTGTCTLTATWAATSNYSLATLTQTTTASLAAPVVTFTGAPGSAAYNSTFVVAAPVTNGVTPTIAASGACSISGSTVTMTNGMGTCTLSATWAATGNYLAATLSQTTTASKIAPTVTFTGAPGIAAYNSTFPVVAPATNGVTPTIAASGACTISSGTVTMTSGTGTCTLTATWAATSNYLAATLSQTTTASKITPIVTFTGAPGSAANNSTFAVVAPVANGVTPTIAASGACTISSGTVTMTSGTGTCTLTATWAATSNYSLATLTQTTTAGLAAPAVTFTGAPGSAAYNSTFVVVAPVANGVTPTIAASGACTILSGTVTMTSGTGTCTLTATWAATGNYSLATLTQTTTASLAAPVVTFTGAPGSAAYNSTFVVVAPVTNGITPTIAASGACTISSGTVTMTSGTGTCTLTATWAATGNYLAATLTQTTTASLAAPAVTFTGAPGSAANNSTFVVVAPVANGVTPTIAASGACTILSGTVTMTSGTGTCTLTATWAATSNYHLASLTQTTTATQATPVVNWAAPAAITAGGALSSVQLDATASVPGAFVYTPPVGTVLSVGSGQTLSVVFTPNDTTEYSTASASTTITVNPAAVQQIDVTSQVQVTTSGLVYSRATGAYSGTLTILNISAAPIAAPIQVLFTNLISSATLTNQTGIVASGICAGAPYITVAASSPLAAGASMSIPVKFTNSGTTAISYAPRILSGAP